MDLESGERVDNQHLSSNTNTNNLISDQDVNISIGLSKAGQPIGQVSDGLSEEEREKAKQEWLDDLEKERMEWEAVESLQHPGTGDRKTSSLVLFNEVLQYFQGENLDDTNIKTTVQRSGFAAFIHFLFGPPRLHSSLIEERNLVFCIAQVQLEDKEEVHSRTLQTIYRNLTGSRFDCPRRGSHWETIGFQGTDPATDLRGVGFLGLLHLLHGITDPNVSSLFMEIYRLSLDEQQNFPFCVMSMNVTRIAIQVLREEKLNRECNRRKQVIAVLNDLYIAVFLWIFTLWKTQFKTMKDSGHVMQEAEKQAKKNPKLLLRQLETTLKEKQSSPKKFPVSPVPLSGPLTPGQANNQRRPSAASTMSNDSEKWSQVPNSEASNSARFVPNKRSLQENHPRFTDIGEAARNDEMVTDL